jgi:hypothetical protein
MAEVTPIPTPLMDDEQEYSEAAFIQMVADRVSEQAQERWDGTRALAQALQTLEDVRGERLTRSLAMQVQVGQ